LYRPVSAGDVIGDVPFEPALVHHAGDLVDDRAVRCNKVCGGRCRHFVVAAYLASCVHQEWVGEAVAIDETIDCCLTFLNADG